MYRHRNGKYLNTVTESMEDDKLVISASRDIQPGEPIHTSFNACSNCSERSIAYGTAGTFPNQNWRKGHGTVRVSTYLRIVFRFLYYEMQRFYEIMDSLSHSLKFGTMSSILCSLSWILQMMVASI